MKMKPPIFKSTVIILILLLSAFLTVQPSQADDIPEPTEPPHLIISGDRWIQEFNAGEKASLYVPIENTGGASATKVEVALAVDDVDKFPFKTERASYTRYLSSISRGSCLVDFIVTVPANAKPGLYPIRVSVSYSSETGAGGSASGTFYVKIINDKKLPSLRLIKVNIDGDRLAAGKSKLVNLNINNDGDLPLKNVEIALSGFTGDTLTLDDWSETQKIDRFNANEFKMVPFRIHVNPDIKSGTYILDLTMTGRDDYDQEYKSTAKVYLPVSGKGAVDDMTPRIIIDNYSFNGDSVIAGQVFPLEISFTNTSPNTAVKNIKISLSSEGQVFAPVGSSNTIYIPAIQPGARVTKTIKLKPKNDAETQTSIINVDIDYQDGDGNKSSEKEIISIPVSQEIRIETSEVKLPPEVYVGNPVTVEIDIYNTGRAVIRNFKANATGDFQSQANELFIGNIEPGKYEIYDATITPLKEGTLKGKFTFDYDDNAGNHHQMEKEFEITVLPPMAPMPPPGVTDGSAVKQEKSKVLYWVIPLILVAAAGVAFVVYRKRKSIKEGIDFDE